MRSNFEDFDKFIEIVPAHQNCLRDPAIELQKEELERVRVDLEPHEKRHNKRQLKLPIVRIRLETPIVQPIGQHPLHQKNNHHRLHLRYRGY